MFLTKQFGLIGAGIKSRS